MSTRSRWGAAGLVGLYLIWGLLAWSGKPAELVNDSYRFYPAERGLNWGAVFEPLNGGITTVVLFSTVYEPSAIAGIQVLAFMMASALLALGVLARLGGHWTGWVIATLALIISLQPAIWSTHMVLASESLAFTSVTLWLAAIVWLTALRQESWAGPVLLTGALGLVAATRPQMMLALVPGQLVLLVWSFR